MQGALHSAAAHGARALWQLGAAARCWPASASNGLPQLLRALSTSAISGEAALAPQQFAAGPLSLRHHAPQAPPALHLDGSRTADPGEPRYTAPYWVTAAVRSQHRAPPVLFSDPWPSCAEPGLRRVHVAMVLQELRAAGRPLTVEEVRDAVNARHQHQDQQQRPETVLSASKQQQQQLPPVLATSVYVKHLLEHLRRSRMLYGKKNPTSPLSPGHPDHPRLYALLPYQAARRGEAEQLARTDEAQRGRAMQQALRRLRNGKPPYPIHRRRAHHSAWQHELAQEAMGEL
ncbi:hypothetical protein TSOC_003113 [Tetrabaena socialis]|uniref:Uncharacterized protein n=1 Tax=Tetrabaena socialis TaxID=47790 RepID=A0A2J8ACB9_9CHLO|nr:hypothetical protein TSOC_003113 [Tetrabaena socialis]|eukprot:PNH10156.1 hypothetical protein TSOC_003113 [Tetrabaena socialis]